jgi:hypothetical protein
MADGMTISIEESEGTVEGASIGSKKSYDFFLFWEGMI